VGVLHRLTNSLVYDPANILGRGVSGVVRSVVSRCVYIGVRRWGAWGGAGGGLGRGCGGCGCLAHGSSACRHNWNRLNNGRLYHGLYDEWPCSELPRRRLREIDHDVRYGMLGV
jgi:hypothetical protein